MWLHFRLIGNNEKEKEKVHNERTQIIYRSSRRELPVNPTIVRVRYDLSWDDVVDSYVRESSYLGKYL
jgi:hypothetical protein